jgi:hypothetical protein
MTRIEPRSDSRLLPYKQCRTCRLTVRLHKSYRSRKSRESPTHFPTARQARQPRAKGKGKSRLAFVEKRSTAKSAKCAKSAEFLVVDGSADFVNNPSIGL